MNASTFVYILTLWSVLDEVLVTNMTFERTLSLATQKIVPAKDVLQHPWSHECHFRIFRMSRIFLSLENRHFWFWKKIAFVLFKTFWYQLVQWMVGTVDQWLQVLLPTFSRLWVRIVALTNFFWKGVTQAIKNGLFHCFVPLVRVLNIFQITDKKIVAANLCFRHV